MYKLYNTQYDFNQNNTSSKSNVRNDNRNNQKYQRKLKKVTSLIELLIFIPSSIGTKFNSVYLIIDKFILNCDKITNFSRDKKVDHISINQQQNQINNSFQLWSF